MSRLEFVVEGDPVPWERCDSKRGQRFTAPRTRDYQAKVRLAAAAAGAKPLEGPVEVRVFFYRATARRCDWDNLAKSVCDALNGLAWEDDSQIQNAHVIKRVDRDRPRAEVEVRQVEAAAVDLAARVPEKTRRDLRTLARALNPKAAMRPSVRTYR